MREKEARELLTSSRSGCATENRNRGNCWTKIWDDDVNSKSGRVGNGGKQEGGLCFGPREIIGLPIRGPKGRDQTPTRVGHSTFGTSAKLTSRSSSLTFMPTSFSDVLETSETRLDDLLMVSSIFSEGILGTA